jgi:predicted ATP-grasp superfamily ATP-dependent carboligase
LDLLILGASARAAAFSAIRIGIRPTCGDLFVDRDLAAIGRASRIDPTTYPSGLESFAATLPPTPWIYTGALENRPALVDRIALRHPLLGNHGAILRAVRDPIAVAATLRSRGLAAPAVRADPAGLPTDGSWLAKPIASAGGQGIRPWIGGGQGRPSTYYQQKVEGLPLAAIFIGRDGSAKLAGISRQFVGGSAMDRRFHYRGSLAPWPVAPDVAIAVDRIGRVLAAAFGLVGIFGVDLILAHGRPWPIEVNPRYTASSEALEWALGRSLLAEHLRACGQEVACSPHPGSPGRFVAKAILRAGRPARWPDDDGLGPPNFDPTRFPEAADVPDLGTRFKAGDPVLTVFAPGETPSDARRRLATRLRFWRARLRAEG